MVCGVSVTQRLVLCCCSRFDLEQSQTHDEAQRERSLRERLSREKDMMTGEVFSLRQQLEVNALTALWPLESIQGYG